MTKTINIPWYDALEERLKRAYGLQFGLMKAMKNEAVRKAVEVFTQESVVEFIYESNTIEREGANWDETKKLLLAPAGLSKGVESLPFSLKMVGWVPKSARSEGRIVTPRLILKHGKLSKDFKIVTQHAVAYYRAMIDVHKFTKSQAVARAWHLLKESELTKEQREELMKIFPRGVPSRHPAIKFFATEVRLKRIHGYMAGGLMKKEDGEPGVYREHAIMTTPGLHYTSPTQVPAAMRRFELECRAHIAGPGDPIRKAAIVSANFVMIHPFGDFNGRLSRVLMNAVLQNYSFPYGIALRGSGESRYRYFNAIKLAHKGNYDRLACLIANSFISSIEDLNMVLSRSGLKEITAEPLSKVHLDAIKAPLHGRFAKQVPTLKGQSGRRLEL